MLNLDTINKTIAALEKAAPERFKMGRFLESCGTVGCIAGWVTIATMTTPIVNVDPERIAKKALGFEPVGDPRTEKLFFMDFDDETEVKIAYEIESSGWFVSLDSFDRCLSPAVRKQAAINVLTILRDTGEVDWLTAIRKAKEAFP